MNCTVKPRFGKMATKYAAEEGSRQLTLICNAVAHPCPEFLWFKTETVFCTTV